jgi:GNAT superfamily N-acetyltransferase
VPAIRRASSAERSQVVATVTAAFLGDPAWGFLMGDDYERLAPEFARVLFDLRVAHGNVWVSDDLASVAMWEGPNGADDPPQRTEEVWARYSVLAGERAHERLLAYRDAVALAASADPHWYLGVLATHPARQGEGLATAVLAPVLEEADRSGIACCLETSTEANRRFYAHRGFTEAIDVLLAEGPRTWWMRRPPRQGRDSG